jgi:hypothetical protein
MSKLGGGSMANGIQFPTNIEAIQYMEAKRVEDDLTDNVVTVMKDYYDITGDSDSWVIHFFGIPGWVLNVDEWAATIDGDDADGVLYSSYPVCTNGINQDGNPFSAGCQVARGCREMPPSLWVPQGCPSSAGCCSDPNGCPTAVTGGPDAIPKNAKYGTDSVGCTCGNRVCDVAERQMLDTNTSDAYPAVPACPMDCFFSGGVWYNRCGDGTCQNGTNGTLNYGETPSNCADCGV